MKPGLVRTSSLLWPKLSCTNSFDKTGIDNRELKIEIRNIAIDRKADRMVVALLASAKLALLAVSNYFDPQVRPYYSFPTMTINKRTTYPT